MKLNHLIIIGALCGALLLPSSASSWGVVGLAGGGGSFCSGDELFCADFETDAMITWDTTPGEEDCDGYDAGGDWCDYDATTYKQGTHSLGIRGANTVRIKEALSSSATEFWWEYWIRMTDVTDAYAAHIEQAADTNYILAQYNNSSGQAVFYYANGAVKVNSNYAMSTNTWYKVRVYFKNETSGPANNGILQVWITDQSDFAGDDSDRRIELSDLDTGAYNAGKIVFKGPDAAATNYWDNVKIWQE